MVTLSRSKLRHLWEGSKEIFFDVTIVHLEFLALHAALLNVSVLLGHFNIVKFVVKHPLDEFENFHAGELDPFQFIAAARKLVFRF